MSTAAAAFAAALRQQLCSLEASSGHSPHSSSPSTPSLRPALRLQLGALWARGQLQGRHLPLQRALQGGGGGPRGHGRRGAGEPAGAQAGARGAGAHRRRPAAPLPGAPAAAQVGAWRRGSAGRGLAGRAAGWECSWLAGRRLPGALERLVHALAAATLPWPSPSPRSHAACTACTALPPVLPLSPPRPCRYLENVPTIVPVLEKEYRNASRRLEETQVELNDLHPEKLKVGGRAAGWLGGWVAEPGAGGGVRGCRQACGGSCGRAGWRQLCACAQPHPALAASSCSRCLLPPCPAPALRFLLAPPAACRRRAASSASPSSPSCSCCCGARWPRPPSALGRPWPTSTSGAAPLWGPTTSP